MTKKIIASFIGLAMALTMVPGVAQGVTDEEWADLMAQLEELQSQYDTLFALYQATVGGTTPSAGVPAACTGITFTVNLSQGSTGNDVKCLQAFLNTDSATQVATTGAGSPGNETSYFGPLTYAAVVRFQNKYAAEILTPLGLTAGTGFVGPATRTKLDAMLTEEVPECTLDADCLTGYECVGGECALVPVECTTDADCSAGFICGTAGECEEEPAVEPAEGELIARWLPTPTGVEVNWGASDVAVGAIELKARDSAITVNRIDINFDLVPWHKISYLALYHGDDPIKGSVIDSSTVSEVAFGTNYRLRLTGLDINVAEAGVKNITIKVNAPTIPRTPGAMIMTVGTDAIRGIDTARIYQYAGMPATSRSFTVPIGGLGARIETKINSDTPEEGFVLIDADTATEHEVLRFDLKVTRVNARVRIIRVNLDNTTNINAVKLYDGSTAIGSQTASTTTTFTDLEVDIVKDTTKPLTVKVVYAATSTAGSVTASVDGSAGVGVVGVSANEETPSYIGSASGQTIYFNASGVQVTFVSATLTETKGEATSTTDYMDGTITFKLAAVGEDVIIPTTGIDVQGWLVASATTTGVTVSPTLITINAGSLASAATTTRTLLAGAAPKTIVAQGRISDSTANLYVRLEVSKVEWTGGSLSAEQIKDLKTEPKIFVKP